MAKSEPKSEPMQEKERTAALWAALAYVAGKEARRDELADGAVYECKLSIAGQVGDQRVDVPVEATLHVGHPSQRASSSGPSTEHLVACLLSRFNERTRERIVRGLPEEFAAHDGKLPEVTSAQLDAAKGLLARLRVKTTVTQRGPVSGHYALPGGRPG